jgi:hypothetical protein
MICSNNTLRFFLFDKRTSRIASAYAEKTVSQGEKWHHTPAIITSENIADTIASNFIMNLQYNGQ